MLAARGRRLGYEICENRHLLSGASITGIVYETANSSGFSAGDVPQQTPVFIDLYKDNGDNVFNAVTDGPPVRQQTAAGTGVYTFSNLSDGHYYIQEEVPANFTQSAGPAFYTVDVKGDAVVAGAAFTGGTVNIDDFSQPNPADVYVITLLNSNPYTPPPTTAPTTDIIGGQRDLKVQVLPGLINSFAAVGFVGVSGADGVFNLGESQNPNVPGTTVTMVYDANGAGLSANLTAGGNNGIRFDVIFAQNGPNAPIDTEVFATGPGGGTATVATSIPLGGPPGFSVFVPFSSFSTTGPFAFSNVSSLKVSFNTLGVQTVDFRLNQIVDVQQSNNFGNFPLLSSLAGFVYVDANNNGNKGTGEAPISGVIVTLMGTNDLGQSVTQTTTTSASGAYLFGNLRPGVYKLTETQPSNFIDGKDTIGTPGGTTSNDMFSNIKLAAGFNGVNNNFGELGLTPAYASKRFLLFPAQPVNLSAVYGAAATATNNAPHTNPLVSNAFPVPSTTTNMNTSSSSTSQKAVETTTSTASTRAFLIVSPKPNKSWR